MATDKLYKLTDQQRQWVPVMFYVQDGYWVPDPVVPGDNETLGWIPSDPIETGWHTSEGGGSDGSSNTEPETECQVMPIYDYDNPHDDGSPRIIGFTCF